MEAECTLNKPLPPTITSTNLISIGTILGLISITNRLLLDQHTPALMGIRVAITSTHKVREAVHAYLIPFLNRMNPSKHQVRMKIKPKTMITLMQEVLRHLMNLKKG